MIAFPEDGGSHSKRKSKRAVVHNLPGTSSPYITYSTDSLKEAGIPNPSLFRITKAVESFAFTARYYQLTRDEAIEAAADFMLEILNRSNNKTTKPKHKP